jgi:hypothetical protein
VARRLRAVRPRARWRAGVSGNPRPRTRGLRAAGPRSKRASCPDTGGRSQGATDRHLEDALTGSELRLIGRALLDVVALPVYRTVAGEGRLDTTSDRVANAIEPANSRLVCTAVGRQFVVAFASSSQAPGGPACRGRTTCAPEPVVSGGPTRLSPRAASRHARRDSRLEIAPSAGRRCARRVPAAVSRRTGSPAPSQWQA